MFGYACDRCREKHQSCNHELPCKRCLKARVEVTCHYTPKRTRSKSSISKGVCNSEASNFPPESISSPFGKPVHHQETTSRPSSTHPITNSPIEIPPGAHIMYQITDPLTGKVVHSHIPPLNYSFPTNVPFGTPSVFYQYPVPYTAPYSNQVSQHLYSRLSSRRSLSIPLLSNPNAGSPFPHEYSTSYYDYNLSPLISNELVSPNFVKKQKVAHVNSNESQFAHDNTNESPLQKYFYQDMSQTGQKKDPLLVCNQLIFSPDSSIEHAHPPSPLLSDKPENKGTAYFGQSSLPMQKCFNDMDDPSVGDMLPQNDRFSKFSENTIHHVQENMDSSYWSYAMNRKFSIFPDIQHKDKHLSGEPFDAEKVAS